MPFKLCKFIWAYLRTSNANLPPSMPTSLSLSWFDQDEVVTFTSTIYPIDAKGMVEKWLLQVDFKNKKREWWWWWWWWCWWGWWWRWWSFWERIWWWWSQVEKQMVRSLRDTIEKAVHGQHRQHCHLLIVFYRHIHSVVYKNFMLAAKTSSFENRFEFDPMGDHHDHHDNLKVSSYYSSPLSQWVLDWPGQAVVCCRWPMSSPSLPSSRPPS